MTSKTIDHTTLAQLAEAGAVRGAIVEGHAGGWCLTIKCGATQRALATQRSKTELRSWRKFETLAAYLKQFGIDHFEVNSSNFDPAHIASSRKRPDSASKLRRAHEAASSLGSEPQPQGLPKGKHSEA